MFTYGVAEEVRTAFISKVKIKNETEMYMSQS